MLISRDSSGGIADPVSALPVEVLSGSFTGASGVREVHLTLTPSRSAGFAAQLAWLEAAYAKALEHRNLGSETTVFHRIFCSDLPNQFDAVRRSRLYSSESAGSPFAVSVVEQPPALPARLSLWAYHLHDPSAAPEKRLCNDTLSVRRGALEHLWTTGLSAAGKADARAQTRRVFRRYTGRLRSRHCRLAHHAVRTWLFVRDVDSDYGDVALGRNDVFADEHLTADTHFIASTGIGGGGVRPDARVIMDAYAIADLLPAQVHFLSALDHLCPTASYGVSFERATAIDYRDRRHVFVSGTASIDARGKILHPGRLLPQLDRALDNVAALLASGGAAFADMIQWIVYARDPADHAALRTRFKERFEDAPVIFATAPVCRPAWLVEIEGIAACPARHPRLPSF